MMVGRECPIIKFLYNVSCTSVNMVVRTQRFRPRCDQYSFLNIFYKSFSHLLDGWTSTCSIRLSPISAESISCPVCVTIFIRHVGGGPVFAIVPAVVNMDTLKPSVTFCSPVLYTHLM